MSDATCLRHPRLCYGCYGLPAKVRIATSISSVIIISIVIMMMIIVITRIIMMIATIIILVVTDCHYKVSSVSLRGREPITITIVVNDNNNYANSKVAVVVITSIVI